MADSDSDGEFERFLQEDEDSQSPEPTARRAKPSGAYSSSSASAVTAAAAALLASSKLTKKHKSSKNKKSKGSDKKVGKRSSKTQLSDSEEAPPNYYDEYSTGRGGGLEDSDADPYAFDMAASAIPHSPKEVEEDAYALKKKKKEDFKSLAKKAVVKSAPISMQDRIAEILKRTGSTQLQADEQSDEENDSDKEVAQSDEKEITPLPTTNKAKAGDSKRTLQKNEESDVGDSDSDAERSSLSDSLGVSASDFEVHLPPKPSLDRKRLSLSSLDSEQFAVNMDALNDNLATPSRYEQQRMTFLKSEEDEDSPTEKDEYGDDDFELEHATLDEDKKPPPPYSPARDEADADEGLANKPEKPFVSQFEKMKALLLADPEPASAEEVITGAEVEGSQEDWLTASADEHHKPLEASDTFGYGDEEFEETEGSRQESAVAAGSVDAKIAEPAQNDPHATNEVEYSADYEADAFEADAAIPTEVSSAVPPEPCQPVTDHKPGTLSNEPATAKSSTMEALLAKYGDFYAVEEEDEPSNEETQQTLETQALPSTALADVHPNERAMLEHARLPVPVPARDSPPSSPPPPPPPDEDEEDDRELSRFTLEAPRHDADTASSTREGHSQPPSAADRFRQIESHVASLRFIQPAGTPALAAANSPAAEAVHPVSSRLLAGHRDAVPRVPPPFIEPMSISFDASLVAEDDGTQREIDELVRSSQTMRQEKRSAAQRASLAREHGLVLRLQQAQRQILQLKEHIETAAASEAPAVEPKRNDEEGHGELGTEELPAVGGSAMSQAALSKLEKEIKLQDNLIAAFQKENERLMQQLKQVRQDVHYDVHEANEELRRQVKKLQDQAGEASTLGGGGDLASKAQYRVAVEARLEAEAHALALQDDLAAAKLSYQQKLNEVTLELDRVKKAKVELECRYEGVDLTQVAQDTQHARELQNDLKVCKKEHAHALSTLQKKLDWYVENQRLLDGQDEELRRLRRQVAAPSAGTPTGTPSKEQRASGPSPARAHRRAPNDIRRIQELENRLAELEEAMRRRHPDSLANLILASRRADEESKTRALERDYDDKVAQLSRELEQAHEASETKLASFRQQQEKLLLQYRRKIKEQEKQLKQLGKAPLPHRATSKDTAGTASDAEVAKVRRFYAEKIKELERKWEAKYRSLRKQQYVGLGSNHQGQEGLTYADSAVVISNLQRQLREQEQELKQEKARVEQLEAESQLDRRPEDATSERTRPRELEEQVADLKAQLEDSERARARLAQTLETVQTLGLARALNADATPAATEVGGPHQTEAELARLRDELSRAREELKSERLAAATKLGQLKQQAAELADKNAQLEAQLAGDQREMQSLQRLAMEAERHNRALEAQAQRVPELEDEVLALRRELELPRTPSMVQYRSLELKVGTLEQKHKLREAELKVVLDRALTSTHLEQLSRERAHRAALAAKNAEIAAFKRQLEEILDELALLQQPPSTRPSSEPTRTPKQPEDEKAALAR